MRVRFRLGPAGSGKTYRCLSEVRLALRNRPEGLPLLFLAPRQATFQIEHALLADGSLQGYTRLQVLSFERVANFILRELSRGPRRVLSEEGRVMLLRALIGSHRGELLAFHPSALLTGFAEELSTLMHEFDHHRVPAPGLAAIARDPAVNRSLRAKLHDIARIMRAYQEDLHQRGLHDPESLLHLATEVLRDHSRDDAGKPILQLEGLWLDGFAELTAQEIEFLAALVPCCRQATLAFCLDLPAADCADGLSIWTRVHATFKQCYARLQAEQTEPPSLEILDPSSGPGRFTDHPELRHLERFWDRPRAYAPSDKENRPSLRSGETANARRQQDPPPGSATPGSVRIVVCPTAEVEAIHAAREIRRFVLGASKRYRNTAVMVRNLEGYADPIRRVFTRYDIPFFLDQRESIAHHPLVELSRGALRMIAFGWQNQDWFSVLKTGLVTEEMDRVDLMENLALEKGIDRTDWRRPLTEKDPTLGVAEASRQPWVRPFEAFERRLGGGQDRSPARPSGAVLEQALRGLWRDLSVEDRLRHWDAPAPGALPRQTRFHGTTWETLQAWADSFLLAFEGRSLRLTEWIPIVEAGLNALTIGVIPPALDQVMVGAVDRSRNPEIEIAFLLGFNETLFPLPARHRGLLSPDDYERLEAKGLRVGSSPRRQLALEQYLGYIACTRAHGRLVISYAQHDPSGKRLNPSQFVSHLRRLFSELKPESFDGTFELDDAQHLREILPHLIRLAGPLEPLRSDSNRAAFDSLCRQASPWLAAGLRPETEQLHPWLAQQIYAGGGSPPVLRSSVSRLEEFASCPFKFFVFSGLKAKPRAQFDIDPLHVGTYQHAILERFHQEVLRRARAWRNLPPQQGRQLVRRIAEDVAEAYHLGLLKSNPRNRLIFQGLSAQLEQFVETVLGWMEQYAPDPEAVELAFGADDAPVPAWTLELNGAFELAIQGKIDRIDLLRSPGDTGAAAVIVDYKSGPKRLDRTLLTHGIQLQLLTYLSALVHAPAFARYFGVEALRPIGAFFANLRPHYAPATNRVEALSGEPSGTEVSFQHTGCFDRGYLRSLDTRESAATGDQFRYRLKKDGTPHRACWQVMTRAELSSTLAEVEIVLKKLGNQILSGNIRVDPYRHGSLTPCDHCDYGAICRIHRVTHVFRRLPSKKTPPATPPHEPH